MAVEFRCPTCQTWIRTAEGTEGRPARCPSCTAIVTVPAADEPFPATLGELPAAAPAPLNPYAAPANPYSRDPFQPLSREELRQRAFWKLIWPAAGMIVVSLLGLAFMSIVGMAFAQNPNALFRNVDDDPAAQAGASGFLIAYFTVGFVSRVVQLLGAIAMIRQRGLTLALAGGIAALFPCDIYCCLPAVPLGVWALILLNTAEVRSAFSK